MPNIMHQLAIVLILLLAAPLSPAVKVDVTLAARTTITSAYVSLSQVATSTGDDKLLTEAGKVLLGKAPKSDEARAITLDSIKQRLKQSGLDADQFAFFGADRPLVM